MHLQVSKSLVFTGRTFDERDTLNYELFIDF